MLDLLDLSGGRGASLSLLGVTRDDKMLLAEGYYAPTYLRKGRSFTDPTNGRKYRLCSGLPAGLHAYGAGIDAYDLPKPLILEEAT